MTPRRRFFLAGLAGLGLALAFSLIGVLATFFIPAILSVENAGGSLVPRVVLLGLGLVAVAELPLMLYALVRMAQHMRGQQAALDVTHLAYVAFPAVYGLLGAVLTGLAWWAALMFLLAPLRLGMSILAVRFPEAAKIR